MIRFLNKNDKKELNNLIKIALNEKMFIVKKKNHHFFGYFEDNKLVGVVGFFTMKRFKTIGFVSAFVLPEYRGKGIYDKLSKERLEYCQQHYNGFIIFITTNNKSRPQMEKIGFKLIEQQYRMYLNI